MAKRLALLVVVSLFAVAAFAQNAAVSAFVTNPGYISSTHDSHYTGAWGVGAEYWFTPRVSAAVHYSTQHQYSFFSTDPAIPPQRSTITFHPLDVMARYHFNGSQRWKPYVGGGMEGVRLYEYSAVPSNGSFALQVRRPWHFAAIVDGGVTFMVNHALGLDFDGKLAVDQPTLSSDQFRVSAGLSWHF